MTGKPSKNNESSFNVNNYSEAVDEHLIKSNCSLTLSGNADFGPHPLGFLDIPAELRDMVYSYHCREWRISPVDVERTRTGPQLLYQSLPFASTCKRVRQEILHFMIIKNLISFKLIPWHNHDDPNHRYFREGQSENADDRSRRYMTDHIKAFLSSPDVLEEDKRCFRSREVNIKTWRTNGSTQSFNFSHTLAMMLTQEIPEVHSWRVQSRYMFFPMDHEFDRRFIKDVLVPHHLQSAFRSVQPEMGDWTLLTDSDWTSKLSWNKGSPETPEGVEDLLLYIQMRREAEMAG